MKVYNIGYERRRIEAFCEVLRSAEVEVLIDVRQRAWSNRPEFRKQALRSAVESVGIEYFHFKSAGNPYRPANGYSEDLDICKRAYLEHLRLSPEIVSEALAFAQERRAAFFCYEAERCRCHRDVLLAELAKRKGEPLEIIDL